MRKLFLTLGVLALLGAGCATGEPEKPQEPAAVEEAGNVMMEKDDAMMEKEGEVMKKDDTKMKDDSSMKKDDTKMEKKSEEKAPVSSPTPEPAPTPAPTPEPEPEPAAPVSQVKSFSMTAKQWDFVPSTITVNKGDTVKLTINSTDVTHGIALTAFGVSERLEPGKSVTVEFVADKVGSHTFFCSFPCGAGHSSMKGTLVVN